ncbi:MAG TPA: ATP-binding protein [Candidatus Babeliaceae bacterium]|nr:ATP-binding protein [Candidatus Babeliaceae bacterium]
MTKLQLGSIISGSLTEGFLMRVSSSIPLDRLKAGKFVVIEGPHCRFFSLVTDLTLQVTYPEIVLFPPTDQESVLQELLLERDMYATATIRPILSLSSANKLGQVKTLPSPFSGVFEANQHDIELIFGNEGHPSKRYFSIGSPVDLPVPVCLDLERVAERSNGIFGKTGTGKTFLTRLVLAGLLKTEKAVTLVFDMHSEYGLQARAEGIGQTFVKGLKVLFPDKIAIFSLDPASTRRRGGMPDVELTLAYQSIRVEDILSLHYELNLTTTACEAASLLAAKHKREWLKVLLNSGDRLKECAQEVGAHPESVAALYRKLKQLERFTFLKQDLSVSTRHDVIEQMIEYLDRGVSVIIEFGNFTSTLCYLLIANIITRRIHARYIEKTEKFLGSHQKHDEPKKLIIAIEEAHKFLNPQAARQTIFGVIAREMRKYYVSLLVIDQRPSSIDAEVLSQIGTKVIAQLNDEKDIQAVLTGTSNSSYLRTVLTSLDSKKQVLLTGHAIPMPIVIETRNYDEEFYKSISYVSQAKTQKIVQELF